MTNLWSVGVNVLLNTGSGAFTAPTSYIAGDAPLSVALGDLNGDGDLDMAVANLGHGNASVLLNTGNGNFAARANYPAGDAPSSVALGDLDGDGDLDMAVSNAGSDDVSVLLNLCGDTTPPACPADFDDNGIVNSVDVSAFINAWFEDQVNGTLLTDWDANGIVNSTDVSAFINAYFAASPECLG